MTAEVQERIEELLEEAIAEGVTMGASVSVRKGGKEQLFCAHGYADAERKRQIARDTIFRLYSMSKPVTAAAAMILMENGKLDFAQPVSDFLPGFRSLTAERNGRIEKTDTPVTVLQLLNMTSGLTYGGTDTGADRLTAQYIDTCVGRLHGAHPVTTEEFANHMGTLPLAFEPDTSWRYGLSADVLGAVIEKASGMRFGEFLEENLFRPLNMKDTGFWVPEEKQERLAKTYESVGGGSMQLYTGDHLCVSNAMEKAPAFESGGAGLVSTLDDYGRFAQMLLNGGTLDGIRVMSERTVRYFTSGSLTCDQQKSFRKWVGLEGYTYSHLMRIMDRPEQTAMLGSSREYGWDGWLGCYFANLPEEDMTILMMMQKRDAGTIPLTRKVRNVILSRFSNTL